MIGTSLGPYRIIEQLGAGGMGEVYLGEDTRLGRKVAIKVLPEEYASDPERLARFEQEARAAAALNHPHIAVVHDIGTEGDTHFMVQEYLEGQSLRERLEKGALPLDKALDLATEVGEALVAAHKAGIIHRDLKPDNIFVTEEGHAKVLDFGLAKLTQLAAPTGSSATMSPTMLGTVAGQVMGTAGYMAPEQVNGEEIDQRADLFAFGAVLYEMASGRQPFAGKSVHDTLHRIVHEEPSPLAEADPSAPFELQHIVKKCLAKKPARRYQHADDLVVDLRALALDVEAGTVSGLSHAPQGLAPIQSGLAWKHVAWVATALIGATAGAVWLIGLPPPNTPSVSRFQHLLPAGTSLRAGQGEIAISRDGNKIAFIAGDHLWLRRLDQFEATMILGTDRARSPFFSPNGEELGFWADGQIWKVGLAGGTPMSLASAGLPQGASWGNDGAIYVGQGPQGVLRVSDTGGQTSETVVTVDPGEAAHGPQLLPGGEWLLFTLRNRASGGLSGWDNSQIMAQSLSGEGVKTLGVRGFEARYVPTGHLVFTLGQELFAVGLDLQDLEAVGQPISVLAGVREASEVSTATAYFDISETGVLAYIPPRGDAASRALVWVDHSGVEEPIDVAPGAYFWLNISPTGDKVAVDRLDPSGDDILVFDLESWATDRLTSETKILAPVWNHDGKSIAYARARGEAGRDLYVAPADGSGEPALFAEGKRRLWPLSWAADGRLLVAAQAADGDFDVVSFESLGSLPVDVVASDYEEMRARLSPDGQWLAYVSDHTSERQVFVLPFGSDDGGRIPVTQPRADNPRWSPDGHSIYYTHDGFMWQVPLRFDPGLRPEEPQRLFPTEGYFIGSGYPTGHAYAVHPDTGKFLMLKEAGGGVRPYFNIVLNWFEELKRLVPTGR